MTCLTTAALHMSITLVAGGGRGDFTVFTDLAETLQGIRAQEKRRERRPACASCRNPPCPKMQLFFYKAIQGTKVPPGALPQPEEPCDML